MLFLLLIIFFNLLLRLYRLDYNRGQPIFDEAVYYRQAALSYLQNRDDPNFEHPPLAKEIWALSIKLLGDNATGWRLPSLLFSLLAQLVVYFLLKEILRDRLIAGLTTIFLSLDFMYFIHARLMVPEMIFVAFCWTSILFFWKFRQTHKLFFLTLTAIFFALALATKWTGLLLTLPFLVLLLQQKAFRNLVQVVLTLTSASLLIYLLTYLPYLGRHSGWDLLNLQLRIINFWFNFSQRLGLKLSPELYFTNHASAWILNPSWIYHGFVDEGGRIQTIWAMYNPILWTASIFYWLKYLLKKGWRNLDEGPGFLSLLVISFYLPWLLVTRVEYPYYFLVGLPFLYAFLSLRLKQSFERNRLNFWSFLATLILVSAYFFPLVSALPVPQKYVNFLPGVGYAFNLSSEKGK